MSPNLAMWLGTNSLAGYILRVTTFIGLKGLKRTNWLPRWKMERHYKFNERVRVAGISQDHAPVLLPEKQAGIHWSMVTRLRCKMAK